MAEHAIKNIDYINKCFKRKLRRSKFTTKNSVNIYISSTPNGVGDSKDLPFLKYNNALEWESKVTLELNAAKSIDYSEKYF